jgi:hypothetical protein
MNPSTHNVSAPIPNRAHQTVILKSYLFGNTHFRVVVRILQIFLVFVQQARWLEDILRGHLG